MHLKWNAIENLLRIPYTVHRTNESVKKELRQKVGKVKMLVSIIKKRQLKWFGHVTRHSDSHLLANNIMHGREPGSRSRSRPIVGTIELYHSTKKRQHSFDILKAFLLWWVSDDKSFKYVKRMLPLFRAVVNIRGYKKKKTRREKKSYVGYVVM